MPFGCGQNGWQWAGVALCLWSLAPRLAPQDLVSNANVRCLRPEPEVLASLASGPDPVEPEPCLGAAYDGWGRAGCRKPRAGPRVKPSLELSPVLSREGIVWHGASRSPRSTPHGSPP